MNNYQNFLFYGSWRTTLDGFREKFGEDYAKTALWNLMTDGTSGEVETEDPFISGWIIGSCQPNIKATQKRYNKAVENGKSGGRPKEVDPEEIQKRLNTGMKHEKIANELGCSTKTVQRYVKEVDKTGQNLDKEKEKDKENENDKSLVSEELLNLTVLKNWKEGHSTIETANVVNEALGTNIDADYVKSVFDTANMFDNGFVYKIEDMPTLLDDYGIDVWDEDPADVYDYFVDNIMINYDEGFSADEIAVDFEWPVGFVQAVVDYYGL